MLYSLSDLTDELYEAGIILDRDTVRIGEFDNVEECAVFCRDNVIEAMKRARNAADSIEKIVGREYWCYPTYGDLMFGVR